MFKPRLLSNVWGFDNAQEIYSNFLCQGETLIFTTPPCSPIQTQALNTFWVKFVLTKWMWLKLKDEFDIIQCADWEKWHFLLQVLVWLNFNKPNSKHDRETCWSGLGWFSVLVGYFAPPMGKTHKHVIFHHIGRVGKVPYVFKLSFLGF